MGFIRNNNVWKINKILAGISGGGVSPEDVQDMIDTSLTPIETAIEGKQDNLTAGDGIDISDNVISTKNITYLDNNDITDYVIIEGTSSIDRKIIAKKDMIIRYKPSYSGSLYRTQPETYFINKGMNIQEIILYTSIITNRYQTNQDYHLSSRIYRINSIYSTSTEHTTMSIGMGISGLTLGEPKDGIIDYSYIVTTYPPTINMTYSKTLLYDNTYVIGVIE